MSYLLLDLLNLSRYHFEMNIERLVYGLIQQREYIQQLFAYISFSTIRN